MKIHRLLLLTTIFFLCIVACKSVHPSTIGPGLNPTDLTASMALTQSRTIRPSATNTRVPFPTLIPTKTPSHWPDLHTAGPYLYIPDQLFEMDGSGMMDFGKNGGCHSDINSPLRWCTDIDGNGPFDGSYPDGGVVLRLVDNWSGTTIDIADLLPRDYRERQERMIEEIKTRHPSEEGIAGASIEGALKYLSFQYSWSPNGRYLSFSGMIDGDSTDIYVYDSDKGTVQRRDDGLLNVSYFYWSPDGKYILFRDGIPRSDANQLDSFSINPLKSIKMDSAGPSNKVSDLTPLFWFSSSEMVMYTYKAGKGDDVFGNDLYIVNVSKGTQEPIWKGWWSGLSIDKENGTMLIDSRSPCEGENCPWDSPGLFLGPIHGNKIRIADGQFLFFSNRNGLINRFIIGSNDEHTKAMTVYSISSDGNLENLGIWNNPEVSFSPDSRWMAVLDSDSLQIFDQSAKRVYEFTQSRVINVSWKTNSQGLFFKTDPGIYYLPMDNPVPENLFTCDPAYCNKEGEVNLLTGIHIPFLPNLRARPPAIDNPSEGQSFWSWAIYEDLAGPGTNKYDVSIGTFEEWRWNFSWCATTEEGLKQALSLFDIEFWIGIQKVGEDAFRIYDHTEGDWQVRTWAILLAGWKHEDQTNLEIHYTLHEAVSNGKTTYPAGEYRQIIHVWAY